MRNSNHTSPSEILVRDLRVFVKREKELLALVKEFEAEIKENTEEIKCEVKNENYAQAAHLDSANGALAYVADRIRQVLDLKML